MIENRQLEYFLAAREAQGPLEAEMRSLLEANCPAMLAIYCCGPINGTKLAVAAGDNPGRVRTEVSFAALCGAAPVRASSGRTDRWRLNRGGDRRANSALHMICRERKNCDPRTQEHFRRRSKGRNAINDREIERCLVRYIAREAYRALTHPFDVPRSCGGYDLRDARLSAGITQLQAARALGVSGALVSKAERGKGASPAFVQRYRKWVEAGLPLDVPGTAMQENET